MDDLLYTGSNEDMMMEFKCSMKREFDVTDLGRMRFFLGIEVLQRTDKIFVCQKKYAVEILERFGMGASKPVDNLIVPGSRLHKDEEGVRVDETYYKQIVGSLMYLTTTRPDIIYSVSLISRFMANPTQLHLRAAKRILRYVRGKVNFGILYKKKGADELVAYTDSDYAGDIEDIKSTSGYAFMFSEGVIAWSSKKQPIVTLSTTEAEFVAAATCACQAVWMRKLLKDFGYLQEGNIVMNCDNNSAIKLSCFAWPIQTHRCKVPFS